MGQALGLVDYDIPGWVQGGTPRVGSKGKLAAHWNPQSEKGAQHTLTAPVISFEPRKACCFTVGGSLLK